MRYTQRTLKSVRRKKQSNRCESREKRIAQQEAYIAKYGDGHLSESQKMLRAFMDHDQWSAVEILRATGDL